MTVGELKRFLVGIDDDTPVVVDRYNSGYGGMFDASAEVRSVVPRGEQLPGYENGDDGASVVLIS